MTNRQWLIKLLTDENVKVLSDHYLTCEACVWEKQDCGYGSRTCEKGHKMWLDLNRSGKREEKE